MQNSKTGFFLIHGLFGSPREFDPLVHLLSQEGYPCHTVTLPGHDDHPSPLHHVNAEQLVDHCLSAYETFSAECDSLVVVGHSLGGMCALTLAGHQPQKLRGVMSLGAAFETAFIVNHPLGWLQMPWQTLFPALQYIPDYWTGCKTRRVMPWHYPKLIAESAVMRGYLEQHLPNIQVPVCLTHSPYDLSVPYGEMEKIREALRSPHVVTHTLECSGHQIFPRSREQERVYRLLMDFLASIQAPASV